MATNPQSQLIERSKTNSHKKLALGWRIGLSTSLIVLVVMGVIAVFQYAREVNNLKEIRVAGLRATLPPLIYELENAREIREIKKKVESFHAAYLKRGYSGHHVEVRNNIGTIVATTVERESSISADSLHVSDTFNSTAFNGRGGIITLWDSDSDYKAALSQLREFWAIHMSLTLASILIFLQLAIRFLVTKPMERLLDGIQQMEMGYWEDIGVDCGAWEIQTLGRYFRRVGTTLQKTVRQFVSAERRAMVNDFKDEYRPPDIPDAGGNGIASVSPVRNISTQEEDDFRKQYRFIKALNPNDIEAQTMARKIWEKDIVRLDKLEDRELKHKLENAAFEILYPEEYRGLKPKVDALKITIDRMAKEYELTIRKELRNIRIPCSSLQYRIKNVAGIWRKMKSKGLRLDQVHDLLAFRIIVPSEPWCYLALATLHNVWEPVVGRFNDYIVEPKANDYRSIHTCVKSESGQVFEIQIRSLAMHRAAESGTAAHWKYKAESSTLD